jgi:hypothetical protein
MCSSVLVPVISTGIADQDVFSKFETNDLLSGMVWRDGTLCDDVVSRLPQKDAKEQMAEGERRVRFNLQFEQDS